jgi:hypothetical protein
VPIEESPVRSRCRINGQPERTAGKRIVVATILIVLANSRTHLHSKVGIKADVARIEERVEVLPQ